MGLRLPDDVIQDETPQSVGLFLQLPKVGRQLIRAGLVKIGGDGLDLDNAFSMVCVTGVWGAGGVAAGFGVDFFMRSSYWGRSLMSEQLRTSHLFNGNDVVGLL